MEITNISEGEVLLATTKYLITERKLLPYKFSVASGKGIDHSLTEIEIKNLFKDMSGEPEFVGSGPDIIAVSQREWWCVECKGVGTGKPQTQRNNFDRALASVVSYYEDRPATPSHLDEYAKDSRVFLGLALPASTHYLKELERRVRSPLRQQLNLWILLYERSKFRAVAPVERDFSRP